MSESAAQAYAMLNAMMDVQKRSVATMDRLASKVHEVVVEVERVARGQTQVRAELAELRSDFNASRADTTGRFAAVGARFDDVERGIDRTLRELQDARSEIVSQNMQTLNAVQDALNVRIQIDELVKRVEAIEAKP